jgi:predicted AlkP superfamily phosphohydrolase/phosphomutase
MISGEEIKKDVGKPGRTRLVDVAPTINYLRGVPPPRDADGGALLNLVKEP